MTAGRINQISTCLGCKTPRSLTHCKLRTYHILKRLSLTNSITRSAFVKVLRTLPILLDIYKLGLIEFRKLTFRRTTNSLSRDRWSLHMLTLANELTLELLTNICSDSALPMKQTLAKICDKNSLQLYSLRFSLEGNIEHNWQISRIHNVHHTSQMKLTQPPGV